MNNKRRRLSGKEALTLFKKADLLELGALADDVRMVRHPEGIVTFIIDRNINYTNVCTNQCSFCAFWRNRDAPDAYLLDRETLISKIEETIRQGGTQILLQGGLHPDLGMDYYLGLLRFIKERFDINIHGFSPPEICYMADSSEITVSEALGLLRQAGLDSIPGGGAEILTDRIREILSPRKIRTSRWLEVMEKAHMTGMRTTATMMFGSIETPEDIIGHLEAIRNLQDRTGGFTAFIPWSFQPGNTALQKQLKVKSEKSKADRLKTQNSKLKMLDHPATAVEYLRVLALSRIFLDNIDNIQASWVTQGLKLAQVALRFGANDFGSTMLEENVVSSTGVSYRVSKIDIIHAIQALGFVPAQRNTFYAILKTF